MGYRAGFFLRPLETPPRKLSSQERAARPNLRTWPAKSFTGDTVVDRQIRDILRFWACQDIGQSVSLRHGSNEASRNSSGSGAPALCCYQLNSAGRRAGCSFAGASMEAMKMCTNCGQEKALPEFHKNASGAGGRHSQCKDCKALYSKGYHRKHRDAINAKARARWEGHPGKYREQMRVRYRRNADVLNARSRAYSKNHKEGKVARDAVRRSKASAQPCEICGTTEIIHGHHEDYAKPLEVRWLCARHHRRLHHGHFDLLGIHGGG